MTHPVGSRWNYAPAHSERQARAAGLWMAPVTTVAVGDSNGYVHHVWFVFDDPAHRNPYRQDGAYVTHRTNLLPNPT